MFTAEITFFLKKKRIKNSLLPRFSKKHSLGTKELTMQCYQREIIQTVPLLSKLDLARQSNQSTMSLAHLESGWKPYCC